MELLLEEEDFIKQVNNGEISGTLVLEITRVTFEEMRKTGEMKMHKFIDFDEDDAEIIEEE